MNSQQNVRFAFSKNRWHFQGSSRHFGKQIKMFFSLVLPCFWIFTISICLFHVCGQALPLPRSDSMLFSCLEDPFYGCWKPSEKLVRVLLCASPSLLSMWILLLSMVTRQRRTVFRSSFFCIFAVRVLGVYYLLHCFDESVGRSSSALIYLVTEFLMLAVLLLYAYRILLCFDCGFPGRSVPGTASRFLSFTFRCFAWSILFVLIRIGLLLAL